MENKKMPIDVIIEDGKIAVRCANGDWNVGELDNRWLWVLNAIANPGEHSISIKDQRRHRQGHQPDMTFSSEEQNDVTHILCEEWEGDDAIREFRVLAVSNDEDALKQLLAAKVEKDEYGFIAGKGIADQSDNYMRTNFECGFVEYYIREEPVLTREQVLEKLNTPEYDTTFRCPENLEKLITPTVKRLISKEGCTVKDPERAAAMVMGDKKFQSLVKEAWWGDKTSIDEENDPTMRAIRYSVAYFIGDKLDAEPDWFVNAGVAERYVYPENLQDILVDTIYNVSRDYSLPVLDAARTVDTFMRDAEFKALFEGVSADCVERGTAYYNAVLCTCTDYVRNHIVPENKRAGEPPKFDSLLKDAQQRLEAQAAQQGTVPEKER